MPTVTTEQQFYSRSQVQTIGRKHGNAIGKQALLDVVSEGQGILLGATADVPGL